MLTMPERGDARPGLNLQQLRLHPDKGHASDGHRRQELLSDAFDAEEGKGCDAEGPSVSRRLPANGKGENAYPACARRSSACSGRCLKDANGR